MSDTPHYTTLRDYLRVIREQRVLIVLIVAVFTAAAVVLALREARVYEAQATLNFNSPTQDLSILGQASPSIQTPDQRAASGAESIATFHIAQLAAKKLKPPIAPGALLSDISVQAEARTNFVVVQARAGDATRAANMANAFATAAREQQTAHVRAGYASRARDLIAQTKSAPAGATTNYNRIVNASRIQNLLSLARFATPVDIVVHARAPGSPVSPKPVRNGLLGLLAGITVALLVAFVRDGLDRRFRSSREMVDELKLPLLGHIPDDVLGLSVGANGRRALTDGELESFRILRTNLEFLEVDHEQPSIVVSSAVAEEGKSTVTAALAATYAATGKRVLLVECDLRRPTLAKRLDLKASPGLSDFLIGDAAPEEILQTVSVNPGARKRKKDTEAEERVHTFACITAGSPTRRPAELLASTRFETFLAEVEQAYDVVLIDSAPLLSIVDTLEILPHVGRIVVCLRASKTTREQARAARAALAHFPDRPTGVVVTGVRSGEDSEYGYYSYAYTSDA